MSPLLLPSVVPAPVGAAPAPTAAGLRPLVIGLDVALGTTGVAGVGWTERITTGTRRDENRLTYLLGMVRSYYRAADFVAIEGPAFARATQRGHDELAAIRWMIRCDLHRRGTPFAVVPPNNRIKYVLGTTRPRVSPGGRFLSPAECKGAVRDAAATWFGVEFEGPARYDRADAYVLLAMGLHHLGHPLADLPTTHTRALDGVAWPERTDQ